MRIKTYELQRPTITAAPASRTARAFVPSLTLPGQLSDLLRICERQLPGKRSPQIGFEELNLPAAAEMEVHIDPMARSVVAAHIDSIGE
jgi:hypothetical protein